MGGVGGDGVRGGEATYYSWADGVGEPVVRHPDCAPVGEGDDELGPAGFAGDGGDGAGGAVADVAVPVTAGGAELAVLGSGDDLVAHMKR